MVACSLLTVCSNRLCEGLKKRNVRGARTQSLETLLREWEVDPAVLVDPDVHFLNESTGIVVPRGDEIGKYIGDKDVVRMCSGEELQKFIEKFATRDPEVAAELMGPNKHTSLGAAMYETARSYCVIRGAAHVSSYCLHVAPS
jgi:hypothetical protein